MGDIGRMRVGVIDDRSLRAVIVEYPIRDFDGARSGRHQREGASPTERKSSLSTPDSGCRVDFKVLVVYNISCSPYGDKGRGVLRSYSDRTQDSLRLGIATENGVESMKYHEVTDFGPVHDEREIEAVVEVLREGFPDLGPRVAEFEKRSAAILGKERGVMVNSGSSALQLAFDLLECEPGDEVITPPLTFSTDIAPLVRAGVTPAFVDIEEETFQIDPSGIEEMITPRTKAIWAPDLIGNCPDWDKIREIADAHHLIVMEDACDVFGSWLNGTPTGTRCDIVVTSFARTHAVTAAAMGGLVATNNPDWFDQSIMRRRHGRRQELYRFGSIPREDDPYGILEDGTQYDFRHMYDNLGYGFQPSELIAAYGLVQLDKLDEYNGRRRFAFEQYDAVLAQSGSDKVVRPRVTEGLDTTWMHYPFQLAEGVDRNIVQKFFLERGIPTRMVFSGNILRQPGFSEIKRRVPDGGLPNADRVMNRALALPTHHGLTGEDVDHIVDVLTDWIND
jgi:CDP-6-deoxy-D-xylo-4-hexulose-3-dehydrase